MCIICLFMVMKKSTKKYISKMGQNTGTSNMEKNVMTMQVRVPLVQANQNLNSGNRLAKGRNSSLDNCGRVGPDSLGSSKGLKKAIKLFNKKIPSPYATMKYPCTMYTLKKKIINRKTNPNHLGPI
mmetsp:Transcript_18151/g.41999  ORF Transcript_18151/g.41999 Transcript_18151/m.41999 type:complete len:126 (+) Transcript_18151:156-533(+)